MLNGMTSEQRPAARRDVWAEMRDAVSLRAFVLVIGTLALGVGFVISYVGALHDPALKNVPVTVVSTNPQATQQAVAQLSAVPGKMIVVSPGTTTAAAIGRVRDRHTGAAYVYNAEGTQDTLIVASAAGGTQAVALERLFASLAQRNGRTIAVDDVLPAGRHDFNGLTSFYLVIGWSVTGYLIASILGISAGTRPATTTRAVMRLITLAVTGFGAALLGTWLVQGHMLNAIGGSFWGLVATGTVLVLGVGAITMALQIAFGVMGIGLAVLLVVILGNPSSGGAIPRSMLPPFWRSIGAFLPPGAGTDAVRSIAYFGGNQTGYPLLILGGYVLVGVVLSLLLCIFFKPPKRDPAVTASAAPAGAG